MKRSKLFWPLLLGLVLGACGGGDPSQPALQQPLLSVPAGAAPASETEEPPR